MARTPQTDQICTDCWHRAVDAFGTGQIFQKRSKFYTNCLQILSFAGLIVPATIGAVVLSFGLKDTSLPNLMWTAGILGIIQLGVSIWSLVANWPENLQYSHESASENFELANKFKDIASTAPDPPLDLELRVAELKARDAARQAADMKRGLDAKEIRYGHRAGLRQFRRDCSGCNQTPTSMESTNCNICGRF